MPEFKGSDALSLVVNYPQFIPETPNSSKYINHANGIKYEITPAFERVGVQGVPGSIMGADLEKMCHFFTNQALSIDPKNQYALAFKEYYGEPEPATISGEQTKSVMDKILLKREEKARLDNMYSMR